MYVVTCTQLRRSKAEKVQNKYSDSLFDEFPGVTGVDVGYRRRGRGEDRVILNGEDDEICLIVMVKKKFSMSELKEKQLKALPRILDGVPVDVIEGEVVFTVH